MKNSKRNILYIGYAILTILAIIFVFLSIFTDDRTYSFVGLIGMLAAYILNFIRNSDDKKSK